MRRSGIVALGLLLSSNMAEAVETVAWHTDTQHAWQAAQQSNRPLLVFVTREDCYYCVQMKSRTYASAPVSGAIRRAYVPLVLDGGQASPLLKELNVTVYPSTFVISSQAVVLDRIDGYVEPEALAV